MDVRIDQSVVTEHTSLGLAIEISGDRSVKLGTVIILDGGCATCIGELAALMDQ